MGLRSYKISEDNIIVSSNKQNKNNIRIGSKDYWSPDKSDKNPFVQIKFDSKIAFKKF